MRGYRKYHISGKYIDNYLELVRYFNRIASIRPRVRGR